MPTRRLLLRGLYNARDLGGFPTADGRSTRFGVFLRSEAPVNLPPEDVQAIQDYGVTASMDLRSTGERRNRPSDLSAILPYYYEKPLFNEAAASGGQRPKEPERIDWGEQYISMAEACRDWALEVLDIAARQNGALLFHCTTGKDRTGLLACYLLSIAGVPRWDIAADYSVSQIFLEPVFAKMRSGAMRMGPPPGEDAPGEPPLMDESFFKTPAEAMLALIDYLTATYGGVLEYLRTIGVSDELIYRVRGKFLEG